MDLRLVIFKASGQRKDLPISNSVTVVGRGEDCGLRVPLKSVSRRHCEIAVGEDEVVVRDLGSSNGTYVNNHRVAETPLKAGDRMVIGPVVFTVQIDGQPEEVQPVKTRGQRMAEVGAPGAEEIVDLEADVVTRGRADDTAIEEIAVAGLEPTSATEALDELVGATGEGQEIDPISALEALAAETETETEDENEL